MFKIINAAITPGIHPIQVKINTIRNEPHPLSAIANGGNIIANKTLINDISSFIDFTYYKNREKGLKSQILYLI